MALFQIQMADAIITIPVSRSPSVSLPSSSQISWEVLAIFGSSSMPNSESVSSQEQSFGILCFCDSAAKQTAASFSLLTFVLVDITVTFTLVSMKFIFGGIFWGVLWSVLWFTTTTIGPNEQDLVLYSMYIVAAVAPFEAVRDLLRWYRSHRLLRNSLLSFFFVYSFLLLLTFFISGWHSLFFLPFIFSFLVFCQWRHVSNTHILPQEQQQQQQQQQEQPPQLSELPDLTIRTVLGTPVLEPIPAEYNLPSEELPLSRGRLEPVAVTPIVVCTLPILRIDIDRSTSTLTSSYGNFTSEGRTTPPSPLLAPIFTSPPRPKFVGSLPEALPRPHCLLSTSVTPVTPVTPDLPGYVSAF